MRLGLTLPASLALSVALAQPAPAVEIAGVTLPDTLEGGGRTLTLNGAAVMTRLVFKVYAVAVYVPQKTHAAETIIEPDEPKALVMHFLRDVSRAKLVDAIQHGFETNGGEVGKRSQPQMTRLLEVVKDMKESDRLTFVYEPGKGSVVTMTDGTTVTLEGKDFADAFLLLWLGPKPPREDLKRHLLGLP